MTAPREPFTPLPDVSDDLAKAIGIIAVTWSHLEFAVLCACTDVASVPGEVGQVIFTQMNLRPRLEIWCLLAERRMINTEDRKMLRQMRTRIEDIQPLRNKYIHGLWVKADDNKQSIVWMNGGKDGANRIDYTVERITAEEVFASADTILELYYDFINWWNEACERLGPLPYTRWPPF